MFTESYSRHLKVLNKSKKISFQNFSDFWCTTTLTITSAFKGTGPFKFYDQ